MTNTEDSTTVSESNTFSDTQTSSDSSTTSESSSDNSPSSSSISDTSTVDDNDRNVNLDIYQNTTLNDSFVGGPSLDQIKENFNYTAPTIEVVKEVVTTVPKENGEGNSLSES